MNQEILFIGAGRRYDLVSLFIEQKSLLNLDLNFKSIERLAGGKPPIGDLIEVIDGPVFEHKSFISFLENHLKAHRTSMIISCMESASLIVSDFDWTIYGVSFWGSLKASRYVDKNSLYEWAGSLGIDFPKYSGKSKDVIVKPKIGFGSRGQRVISNTDPELKYYLNNSDWIVQDRVEGPEVSIDCYITKDRRFSSIARDRIHVVGGEVMDTKTRCLTHSEFEIVNVLIQNSKLLGPVNIQLIGINNLLLDINPRFSGGATASIRSGWLAPNWLIQEYILHEEILFPKTYDSILVTRSRRDHVRVP